MQDDFTARRLFDGAPSSSLPLSRPAAAAMSAPRLHNMQPAERQVALQEHSAAEAEQALRGLEAEWAMRMEAPLSALANLEETLAHAIDRAHESLPTDLTTAAANEGADDS